MTLVIEIERFLKASGIPPTRFGREVLNDPKLLEDLRAGRQLRERTRRRIHDYLAAAGARP